MSCFAEIFNKHAQLVGNYNIAKFNMKKVARRICEILN